MIFEVKFLQSCGITMPNLICDNDVHYSIEIVLYNNYLDAITTINVIEKYHVII